nr:TonB-dependent receptor plug domain-containing protein [Acinetobacter sp. Marseille-Q1620]
MKQTFRIKPLVVALSFLSTILPSMGYAQETSVKPETNETDADVITLGDVVVTASSKKKITNLPTRKVRSIYGTDSTVLDTPRVVSQVSEQQFREDVIRSADDLVKYAPSITRGGGQNANFAPQIRGQNSEVFQDNQRVYSNRHPTNFNAYEAADIVAGPTGIIYAPTSGSGGYINYITKKPNFIKRETTLQGTVGSWYEGNKTKPNFSLSVDHTAPINEKLAFRVSATAQKSDDYYDNVKNNFNAFFGALSWRPNDKLKVDWNISYDDYYDFNVTHGWNRATQESVDSGLYYKGRATPIIQNGSSYWSPVFASGAANSSVIGWQERQKNNRNQYVAVGEVHKTALPNATAAQAGTIRGWVYDPSIPGNGLVKLKDSVSGRDEDKNSSKRLSTQLRIIQDLNDHWSISNSTLYQNNKDLGNSVGSFFTDLKDEILDNRFELLGDHDFELFGIKVSNKSSTGTAFRHESFKSLAANNSFNINPYDLTNNPSNKNPGALLGLNNPTHLQGGWIGQAGIPQYSSYFGYLNLPQMYPIGGGLYAEKGGFPTSGAAVYTGEGFWDTLSVFTQQNFVFNDVAGINLGINHSSVKAKLENPVVINPADARSSSGKYSLLSYQISPFIKPTKNSTIYFTYDKSTAINTGVFGPFLTWGPGNRLNPDSFDSTSELKEVGIKYEPLPDKLFLSLSWFDQTRDLSPDTNGNMAKFKIKGIESSIRWQPRNNLAIGANLTKFDAEYTDISLAGFSPVGFVPDNATVWGDSNVLNQIKAGRHDAEGIPKYSASTYIDYRHHSGFGANLSAWWSSWWYTNISQTVKVPNNYNLDLGLYYRQPQWTVGLNILNLTNERNFVNGLSGANTEFLQPMRPLTVQGQFSYKF